MGISEVWTTFFLQPMLNTLLWLYSLLGHNFALSITVFTILVRLITLPLTIPQMTSAKKMQALQPKLKEIQKKHAGDKETLSRAQMELYKQHGVNPLGGCLPTLIQFPIWIGLYQAIYQVMAINPLQVLHLSKNIYASFPSLSQLIPLDDRFLWLNLGKPDPYYILPVLVAASMYFQQKLMTTPSADPSAESMTKSMTYTMPLMFGFFSLSFASGLSIYFIVSGLVGIAIQWGLNKYMESKEPVSTEPVKAVSARTEKGDIPSTTAVESAVSNPGRTGDSAPAVSNPGEKGKRRRARKKKR